MPAVTHFQGGSGSAFQNIFSFKCTLYTCSKLDTLLWYGAHGEWLRDAVAALAWRMTNTIVSLTDIQALASNCPLALDKYPAWCTCSQSQIFMAMYWTYCMWCSQKM